MATRRLHSISPIGRDHANGRRPNGEKPIRRPFDSPPRTRIANRSLHRAAPLAYVGTPGETGDGLSDGCLARTADERRLASVVPVDGSDSCLLVLGPGRDSEPRRLIWRGVSD